MKDVQTVAKPQTGSKLKAAVAFGLAAAGAVAQSAYAVDLSGATTEINGIVSDIEPLMTAIIAVFVSVIAFGVARSVLKRF